MSEKISRRDFLKLASVGSVTTALALAAPTIYRKLTDSKPNTDVDHPLNSPDITKAKDICAFGPVTTFTPTEHISQARVEITENFSFFSENQIPVALGSEESFKPMVNHARADNLPMGANSNKEVFGIELWSLGDFNDVEIAENVNPLAEQNKPRKIVTATMNDQTLLAVSYDANNIPADYAKDTSVPEGNQLTEIFSLTDVARYLVANSREFLGVSLEDACSSVQVDQTMIIGTDCVVARIDINGRKGFFAFDVITRKPIELINLYDLYSSDNGFGYKNIYPANLDDFDYSQGEGVIMSKNSGSKIDGDDTIIDVKNGIIAGRKLYHDATHNSRNWFTFGFVPEHTLNLKFKTYNIPDVGPLDQRSSLRLIPFTFISTKKGDELDECYPFDWQAKSAVVKPFSEKIYSEENSASSKPPKLIMRELHRIAVSEGSTRHPESREQVQYTGKLVRLDMFDEEDTVVSSESIYAWPVKLGDQFSHLVPKPEILKGKLTVGVGSHIQIPLGNVETDQKHKVPTPFLGDSDLQKVIGMELTGKLEK